MKSSLPGILALSAAGLAASGAMADEGLAGVYEERHEMMENMAAAMQSIGNMMRGVSEYDADRVRDLASQVADLGGDKLIALFPEGSFDPEGEALPAIWDDFDRFSELARDLTAAATALAEAADRPPPPRPAPGAGGAPPAGQPGGMNAMMAVIGVGRVCRACHDDFREEQD